MNTEERLKERVEGLQRTISFLCNEIANAIDDINKINYELAKLRLKEAVDDPRYIHK